jgi:hypothetical protein
MQVTVTVRTLEAKFPGGTVGGNWRIELAEAADPATVTDEYEGAAPNYTFDLPEGTTYVIRGARLDAASAMLGPIATAQFTVGEDLVPIDVANTVSAVSSPTKRASDAKP